MSIDTPNNRPNLMDIGKPAGGCGCGDECACGGHGEADHGHQHSKEHFQAKLDALRAPAQAE